MKQIPTWSLVLIHYLLSQALGVVKGNEVYAVLAAYLSASGLLPGTAPVSTLPKSP